MLDIDTDKLQAAYNALYSELIRGNDLVKCIVHLDRGFKLEVTAWHADTRANPLRRIYSPIVGFSSVAEPNDQELSTISSYVKGVLDKYGFKCKKGYRYKQREGGVTYFVSPNWGNFRRRVT